MIRLPGLLALLTVALALSTAPLEASDVAKEKRWANQIVDALIDGEAVWLNADGHEFLGIYTAATDGSTDRAAILLHGIGVHPDWAQVIHPLRVGLTERGWSTLSLQMPVLGNEADPKEYAPLFDEVPSRIDAGIAFLKEKGARHIALIGHSLGATMATYYLATAERPIEALVAIGMPGGGPAANLDNTQSLRSIRIPVFDLYGSNDLDIVLTSTEARAEAAKAADNQHYRQTHISGADHFFNNMDDTLVETVSVWLDETVPRK
jgi:pimeloyl-ACP methyl ester carboxylesterase